FAAWRMLSTPAGSEQREADGGTSRTCAMSSPGQRPAERFPFCRDGGAPHRGPAAARRVAYETRESLLGLLSRAREHGIAALRLGSGHFLLQHVPVLDEPPILDPKHVDRD